MAQFRINWLRTNTVIRQSDRGIKSSLGVSADVAASSADIVTSNLECFMMFYNVLSVSWCFTSGSWCFISGSTVSWCFTSVSQYFTMFSESRNDWHRRLYHLQSPSRRPPIALAIAITPHKSAVTPWKWSHAKLRPEWRLE